MGPPRTYRIRPAPGAADAQRVWWGPGARPMLRTRCPNFNHGRANAPVRCCPMCGEPVNDAIPAKRCAETAHAQRRRQRDAFCLDCGTALHATP